MEGPKQSLRRLRRYDSVRCRRESICFYWRLADRSTLRHLGSGGRGSTARAESAGISDYSAPNFQVSLSRCVIIVHGSARLSLFIQHWVIADRAWRSSRAWMNFWSNVCSCCCDDYYKLCTLKEVLYLRQTFLSRKPIQLVVFVIIIKDINKQVIYIAQRSVWQLLCEGEHCYWQ